MYSMTGMGKAAGNVLNVPVRVEIKSVNHRFCEINFRAPGKYAPLEILVQQLVKKFVTRGRIDIYVNEEKTVDLSPIESQAFQSYFDYLANIKELLKLKEDITLQNLLPGVNNWIQKELNPQEAWKDFEKLISKALNDLNGMRKSEGLRLKQNISERIINIEKIKENISNSVSSVKAELEEKIGQKIKDKVDDLKEVDPQRLAAEVLFYLDRLDISEELERLGSHLVQFQTFLDLGEPIGRKMDFLLQEFNREFNTIASKSQNVDLAHLVVEAKSELEKIREQIQNIE